MHTVRALRGGLPECPGQRDAVDSLGRRASSRAMGWRARDRWVELRLLWPLHHRLSLQCADGKIHAWPRGLLHQTAERHAVGHDRHRQGHRTRTWIWADPTTL